MHLRKLMFLFYFLSSSVYAQNHLCDSIFKSSNYGCDDAVRAMSIGGSYPLLFDALNVNPASLPTFKTPLGVEGFFDRSKFNYAFIKGFKGVGTGLSVLTTESTFFSPVSNLTNAVDSELATFSEAEEYAPNINWGTSVHILGSKGSWVQMTAGASVRYDKEDGSLNYEGGTTLKFPFGSLGYTFTRPGPQEKLQTLVGNFRIMNLFVDYTYFINEDSTLTTTRIISLNWAWRSWQFVFAQRKQEDKSISDGTEAFYQTTYGSQYQVYHTLLGFNYHIVDSFRLGLMSNYVIEKGTSMVVQYFF